MSANKVVCPDCGAVLKSATNLPPRAQVKCPSCKASFLVPGVNRPLRIALVLAGSFLFLLVGGILLAWCLSNSADQNSTRAVGLPIAPPSALPAPRIKTVGLQRPLVELTKEETTLSDEMIRKGVDFLKSARKRMAPGTKMRT